MKTTRLIGAAVLPTLLACGCSTLNHTENGALAGGAIGAGTGALIGSVTHHAAGGALIGGAVGALAGGAIGSEKDKEEKRAIAAAQRQALSLAEVAQLSQQHYSDAVIINQIRTTRSVYHLSAGDIQWLKSQGVSDPVVMEMQATAVYYPRRVYSAAPVYAEPVYVEPPPPPVAVGVGFSVGR
jgi:hypothetical protein